MTYTDGSDNRSTAYDQLCTSYHAIDDFRAKLLGFLPLVTGEGLTVLIGRTGEMRTGFFRPVGIFGILVTTGLLAYELNGIPSPPCYCTQQFRTSLLTARQRFLGPLTSCGVRKPGFAP